MRAVLGRLHPCSRVTSGTTQGGRLPAKSSYSQQAVSERSDT
jgi:hypothetical protein